MSNKYLDHLQVIVEDDANRQLINGLSQHHSLQQRRLQVLPPAGGWRVVLDILNDPATIQQITAFGKRHLLLLIDFDGQFTDRLALYEKYKASMTPAVSDRIYLLGCLHEPEKLRAAFNHSKSFEQFGRELADECAPYPAQNLWQHEHLQHNANELSRLVAQVKPFLFVS
ncbi:DUF4276 domain-containing protein [Rhodanobacter sp. Root179]|uniref:hypothetical protein n=1 Tax=Rhodanobacter sp. Root179 TaxID=1736482 RepID=UPI0007020262|nr:hypothetical protein [Rhodanobacter sp. Root179]KRB61617.1 hypothetical protein ASD82_00100 [Rhodanobacter sp. Root179]